LHIKLVKTMYFKSFFLCLYFFLHTLTLSAQWSLSESNFPQANTSYEHYYCFYSSIGNSGTGQNFDFSSALIWISDTLNYLNPVVSSFYSLYPLASVSTFTPGNVLTYKYFSSDTSAYWGIGTVLIGDFGSGWDTLYGFNNSAYTDTLLSTDYTYGHNETEISKIYIHDGVLDVIFTEVKIINVDASGDLQTPFNYFSNTIRVKKITYKYDSIFVASAFYSATLDTLYDYQFFVPNVQGPVVTVHTNAIDTVEYVEIIKSPDMINGCTDTNAQNFNPIANVDDGSCYYCQDFNISITNDTGICIGDTMTLSVQGESSYLWSTGDTTPSISINPDTSRVYSVYISDTSNCWEMASVLVEVYFPVSADFWIDILNPSVSDTIRFVNLSQNAMQYFWDFGDIINTDTSTQKNPLYKYATGGTKNIMLVASNLCFADTIYHSLFVATDIDEQNAVENIDIYPNPGNIKNAILSFYLKNNNKVSVSFTDITGKRYTLTDNIYFSMGEHHIKIRDFIYDLPVGMYIIKIEINGKNYIKKWLILK